MFGALMVDGFFKMPRGVKGLFDSAQCIFIGLNMCF